MTIEVTETERASLDEYAGIPIAFEVNAIFDVAADPTSDEHVRLTKRPLTAPYLKNYDAIAEKPEDWPRRFDTSRWDF